MLSLLKKIWHDPVWSKVISTGIIALLVLYFTPWWASLVEYAKTCWLFLFRSSDIKNWLLILMAICTLLISFLIVAILWQLIKPNESNYSWKESYRQDTFFNVLWRWSYTYSGQLESIYSFCPKCDFQVYAKDSSYYAAAPQKLFYCDCCNTKLFEFEGHHDELENKVIRLIQQKIRNGNWKISESKSAP